MRRHVVLSLLVVLSACGADQGGSPTRATDAQSSAAASTSGASPTPTTTAVPVETLATTVPPPSLPSHQSLEDLPARTVGLPEGALIESVTVAADGALASGTTTEASTGELARPMIWFTETMDEWVETSVIDLYPEQEPWTVPVVTDVAAFGGRFYAFLMGDEATTATEPSMLVSDDGTTWRKQALTAEAALRAVALTPESPPYPGASAVTDATIYRGRMYATGWTRTAQGTSAALWSSTNGDTWDLTVLPNAAFPNEWGSGISVGDVGFLVSLGGPVHSGAGVLFSDDGDTWSAVDVGGRSAMSVSQNGGMAFVLRFDLSGSAKTDLMWTEDGAAWQVSPPVPGVDETLGSLGSGSTRDPFAFSIWEPLTAWAFDRGRWVEVEIPQLDRLIAATEEHFIGVSNDELVILDRWLP